MGQTDTECLTGEGARSAAASAAHAALLWVVVVVQGEAFTAASGSVRGEGISQVRGIGFHSHINSSQVGAASRRARTEGIGGCARLSREELCNQGSPSATFVSVVAMDPTSGPWLSLTGGFGYIL